MMISTFMTILLCVSTTAFRLRSFEVSFQSISGILYTNFTSLAEMNGTVVVGDQQGFINVFLCDYKKGTLSYKSTARPITPTLQSSNPVIKLAFIDNLFIFYLNSDGQLHYAKLNPDFSISKVGEVAVQKLSLFTILNETHFIGVSAQKLTFCLYRGQNFTINPQSKISKVYCKTSVVNKFLDVSVNDKIVAIGSQKSVLLFRLVSESELMFLMELFLLKSDEQTLQIKWVNSNTLIADNGLWLSSIVLQNDTTSGKVFSSQRIDKSQPKGESNKISLILEDRNTFEILVNGRNKGQVYEINNQSKLTFKNQSTDIGKIENQELISTTKFISTQEIFLQSVNIDTSANFTFKINQQASISSCNHYSAVTAIAFLQNVLISVSNGNLSNVKLWKIDANNSFQLLDEKTFTFFTILKSGYISFNVILVIPPQKNEKINKNETNQIIIAGSQPYELILLVYSSSGKISISIKSTVQHSGNITCLFLSNSFVLSGSKDTSIVTWILSPDHRSLNKSISTLTRNGPISGGLIDSSKSYIILTHDNTPISKLANISLWKIDDKTGKILKIAQNVVGEAHVTNITSVLFAKGQKYFVTYCAGSGELKLWQHAEWTIVDLLGSLSLGIKDMLMTLSQNGDLILESSTSFYFYSIQSNGFVFLSKVNKSFSTFSTFLITYPNNVLIEGAADGALRLWKYSS